MAALAENGWRSSKRQPVGNRALWEELLELTTVHQVTWVKVKGHSDDEPNSRCDQLAVAARERRGRARGGGRRSCARRTRRAWRNSPESATAGTG